MHILIAQCWKSHLYNWIRLVNPNTNKEADFRILRVCRSMENQYLIVSSARHCNVNRNLRYAAALSIVDQYTVRVSTEQECELLSELLETENRIFSVGTENNKTMCELPGNVFGAFPFSATIDVASLGLTFELHIGCHLSTAGEQLPVEVTRSGHSCFLKVESNEQMQSWQMTALFAHGGRNYAALILSADMMDGIGMPPVVLVEWQARPTMITALDEAKFNEVSSLYMDACENFNIS